MKKLIVYFALSVCALLQQAYAELKTLESSDNIISERLEHLLYEPKAPFFVPPDGWMIADPSQLPKSIKLMVIGKNGSNFPPSINLATEKFTGSLQDYLKIVREINAANGADWKSLGTLQTTAGPAHLSQLDVTNEWGKVRMIHVILIKDGVANIMTAASLKDDFAASRNLFLQAMRSLRVNKTALEMIESSERRVALEVACNKLKEDWQSTLYQEQWQPREAFSKRTLKDIFTDETFQDACWKPFFTMLEHNYADMHAQWHKHLFASIREELLKSEEPLFTVAKREIEGMISMGLVFPIPLTNLEAVQGVELCN